MTEEFCFPDAPIEPQIQRSVDPFVPTCSCCTVEQCSKYKLTDQLPEQRKMEKEARRQEILEHLRQSRKQGRSKPQVLATLISCVVIEYRDGFGSLARWLQRMVDWAWGDFSLHYDLLVMPVIAQGVSPSLSPRPSPHSANDEDSVWTAGSRPESPVQERGTHTSVPDRDSPFSSSSVHENNILSSRASAPRLENPRSTPSRMAYKEKLLQTIQGWGSYTDQVQRLKTLIHYEDDDQHDYLPELTEIIRERKRYENYVRIRFLRQERAFHIYGTDELFSHDHLRCWVKLRLNTDPDTPYPPGYETITDESDNVSVAGTLFAFKQ